MLFRNKSRSSENLFIIHYLKMWNEFRKTHSHTQTARNSFFAVKWRKITIIIYRIEPNSIWDFDNFEKVLYNNFVSIRYRKIYISCFYTIMKYKCWTLNVFSAVSFFSSASRNINQQNTQTNIAHRIVEQHLSLSLALIWIRFEFVVNCSCMQVFFLGFRKKFETFQLWRYYYYLFVINVCIRCEVREQHQTKPYMSVHPTQISKIEKKQIIFKQTYVHRWIILLCKVLNISNKCVLFFTFFCANIRV